MPPLHCANAPSTASLFIQLSMRRQSSSSALRLRPDLLVPSLRSSYTTGARHRPASSSSSSTTAAPRSAITPFTLPRQRPATSFQPKRTAAVASFSTSFPRGATQAIYNRQVDEAGNEMVLEITPRAAKRLSEIMKKDANPHLALRIQVESGGCHGFQYLMRLVTLPPTLPSAEAVTESEVREDDTIFSFSADGSTTSTAAADLTAPKIILDLPSLELLKGSKVDFTMELIGSQFKIVDNPLATSSCGCGTSFDIKA
ncbi:hypothetical protein B0T19DRAFT_399645 [Cercophora scortea]|uniref:FeS cluster biogenesis domain-containing protein n=1 Tax=Cercophora scortea TaxID=314031 RepID=A0AAE0IZ99_9PEZI|nr:hypothetical protein B0T19DRAFT_399645 [Cercophora scortea]